MGYNPQESLENTIDSMGTLLGVHQIVPWTYAQVELYLLQDLGLSQWMHTNSFML